LVAIVDEHLVDQEIATEQDLETQGSKLATHRLGKVEDLNDASHLHFDPAGEQIDFLIAAHPVLEPLPDRLQLEVLSQEILINAGRVCSSVQQGSSRDWRRRLLTRLHHLIGKRRWHIDDDGDSDAELCEDGGR